MLAAKTLGATKTNTVWVEKTTTSTSGYCVEAMHLFEAGVLVLFGSTRLIDILL